LEVILNNPKKLNAINVPMVNIFHEHISQWHSNPEISAILLKGEGKAFCAGGDVATIAKKEIEKDRAAAWQFGMDFLRGEFIMDYKIATMRPL
jgi:3-hydroxyisobutyryl-CoA hydrolase